MYIPRGWHWLGPIATVLAGFYIHENLDSSWDVIVFVNVPLATIALEWGAYIWQAGVVYQKYLAGIDIKPSAPTVAVQKTTPPIFVDGQELHTIERLEQTVDMPTVNAESYVAKTLINQRNGNLSVDLTETFWIKGNRFDEGQLKFRAMLRKWQFHSAIAKGNYKTASYSVTDWRKMRMISYGHVFPPPPPTWNP